MPWSGVLLLLLSLFCITVLFSDMNLGDFRTGLSTEKDRFSGPGSGEALSSAGGLYTSREIMSRERIKPYMVLVHRKIKIKLMHCK